MISTKLPRPKLCKVKQTKLPTLIDKADKITSLYIRQKHADHSGNVVCISCQRVLHWKDSHCAHYIERAAKATRWLEENLKPACPSCNVYRKEFHKREYTLAMIDLHGRAFVDELKAMSRQVLSASQVRMLAEQAIDEFGAKLKALKGIPPHAPATQRGSEFDDGSQRLQRAAES